MDLNPGYKIRDYQIISLIGSGGMGEVWLARDTMLVREVAIKRLNHQLTLDADFATRFQNEARIQASLRHPNIVGMLVFFTENDEYFMVLEYAQGITLRELIDRTGPIPEQRSLRIFYQIAAALGYAHAKGIIHRDVKPSNIMVDTGNSDHVMIMDFGIARLLSEGHLTRTGTRLGTMYYMSPEQVLAKKDIDARSDVYSAGVVLYEMLCGRLPFSANTDSDYEIQHQIMTAEMPDPREVYSNISNGTVDLLRSYTLKDRNLRPAGFGENAQGMTVPTPASMPPETLISTPPWSSRIDENMVLVEGGNFRMGSEQGQDDARPVHTVTLSSFYICRYQVTQAEWLRLMVKNPSDTKGDDLPVNSVSWFDAVEFCNRLSVQAGLRPCYPILSKSGAYQPPTDFEVDWSANGYRLPTEAEWEYAARGGRFGRGFQFSGSDDLDSVAWHRGNSGAETHPVGSKQANELGLFDMSGNVSEWCWDWNEDDYYAQSPVCDPLGPDKGFFRVLRGGSCLDNADDCRVADRDSDDPFDRTFWNGFRLCRNKY